MKINNLLKFTCFFIIALFFLNSCGKQVDAKKFPPDPKERVKRNLEEGRGFRLSTKLKDIGKSGGGKFEFASSNDLWRATLDVIDFMPIATANYSGGIIVTTGIGRMVQMKAQDTIDFYLTKLGQMLLIKNFYKICKNVNNCSISEKLDS